MSVCVHARACVCASLSLSLSLLSGLALPYCLDTHIYVNEYICIHTQYQHVFLCTDVWYLDVAGLWHHCSACDLVCLLLGHHRAYGHLRERACSRNGKRMAEKVRRRIRTHESEPNDRKVNIDFRAGQQKVQQPHSRITREKTLNQWDGWRFVGIVPLSSVCLTSPHTN